MEILPLKSLTKEDKHLVGLNLYNLGRLHHFGFPVTEGIIVVPPEKLVHQILEKYSHIPKTHLKNYLSHLQAELTKIPIPEKLVRILDDLINEGYKLKALDIKQLWMNLIDKWFYEITSKISREDFNNLKLTPQLISIISSVSVSGFGFFDDIRKHAVIKTESGTLSFEQSLFLENLITHANKKLLIPQIYHWIIEGNELKFIKLSPFTQSTFQVKEEDRTRAILNPHPYESLPKTVFKVFINFPFKQIHQSMDGILFSPNKDWDRDEKIMHLSNLAKAYTNSTVILELPEKRGELHEWAESLLYTRNKKNLLNTQLLFPKVSNTEEFLQIKRDLASMGIYSKGSLKMWFNISSIESLINFDQFLEAGFDGIIIDMDQILESILQRNLEHENLNDKGITLVQFLDRHNFREIIRSSLPILVKGKIAQTEEVLNYLLKKGVTGIITDENVYKSLKMHLFYLEKITIKHS